MKRREFLHLGGLGVMASTALPARSAESFTTTAGQVREPAREVPVAATADVVVCGGGPAGVAAAISAARKGARTILLEAHGCLGGIWTSGLLSYLLDINNKKGLMQELVQQFTKREGRAFAKKTGTGTSSFDSEVIKIVLEEMCAEAGVRIQYHTRVCAALRSADSRLSHVITESKSGREAFAARVFVDCTGDGDVAALAGCKFDYGHPETGRTQPMSMICLVTGIVPAEVQQFYRENEGEEWATPKDRLRGEMEKGGHSPSYAKPSLFRVRDDLFLLMANHEYEFKPFDARDVTAATLKSRRELNHLVDGLRSLGGAWKNLRLVATAEQIGTREGRRIHGLYTVTADDARAGRAQPDAVCRVTFGFDVHATDPRKEKGIESSGTRAKPYDIPLRSLIARDIKGLMMAGRCISGDFLAHSSYRVTGNAAAMGEAAGKTAALAAKSNRLPQEVSIAEVNA